MYTSCEDILNARKVFDEMQQKTIVTWNSMLDGYAKCEDLVKAHENFELMPDKDIVSWSSLIDGYVKGGEYGEALKVFERNKGTLEQGKPMHCYIIENNLTLNLKLLTFVVDMYAKCGAIEEVVVVFRSAPKDKTEVHLWNAIIRGLASHEYVREVEEAYDFLNRMPLMPTPSMLGAEGGCMSHGRLDLAEILGKYLVEVDPHHDRKYVGLSNVYAAVKRGDDAKMMRQAMDITGGEEVPRC
ncbi:unnamed protein product [Amaranthus hypochondriacus]